MKTYFADPADLLNFTLTITPDEGESYGRKQDNLVRLFDVPSPGMYKGGAFVFSFMINPNYPHDPPKVKCTQTVIAELSPT
jgi:ubiquitin-conjugating enzyme E2 M